MLKKDDQVNFNQKVVTHIAAGGFVFCKDAKKLFVALIKDHHNRIVIPKGHLKKKEKPEEAAQREIIEELGLKQTPELLFFIDKVQYRFTLPSDNRLHVKDLYIYAFWLDSMEKLEPQLDEGISEATWFPIEGAQQIIQYNAEFLARAIKQVKELQVKQ